MRITPQIRNFQIALSQKRWSLITGSGINFVIIVVGTVLGFLEKLVLSRIFGLGNFGEYIYVQNLVELAAVIGTFGLTISSIRNYCPIYWDKKLGLSPWLSSLFIWYVCNFDYCDSGSDVALC